MWIQTPESFRIYSQSCSSPICSSWFIGNVPNTLLCRNKDSCKTSLGLEKIIFSTFINFEIIFVRLLWFAGSLRKVCYANKQTSICFIVTSESIVLVMPRNYLKQMWFCLQECNTSQCFVNINKNFLETNGYDLAYCPVLLIILPGANINGPQYHLTKKMCLFCICLHPHVNI